MCTWPRKYLLCTRETFQHLYLKAVAKVYHRKDSHFYMLWYIIISVFHPNKSEYMLYLYILNIASDFTSIDLWQLINQVRVLKRHTAEH